MTSRTSSTTAGRATRATVERIVDLARRAPSVHNTQPWTWRRDDHPAGADLALHADLNRALPVEDPLGRNLAVSCGAALHHVQFAARALGWDAEVERLPSWRDPTLLARVHLAHGTPWAPGGEDLSLIEHRCTDRRRFTAWPVPEARLEELCRVARGWGVAAQPVADPALRFRLEALTHRATGPFAPDGPGPAHLAEQEAWIGRDGDDGIPLEVLPHDPAPLSLGGTNGSRFGPGTLVEGRVGIGSGDGLVVLGTEEDDVASWLRAGEALSALWLHATGAGLSVVPISQPIESERVRREIRAGVLLGGFVPHLLLRVGWQAIGRSDLPRTPRRPLADVLQG